MGNMREVAERAGPDIVSRQNRPSIFSAFSPLTDVCPPSLHASFIFCLPSHTSEQVLLAYQQSVVTFTQGATLQAPSMQVKPSPQSVLLKPHSGSPMGMHQRPAGSKPPGQEVFSARGITHWPLRESVVG